MSARVARANRSGGGTASWRGGIGGERSGDQIMVRIIAGGTLMTEHAASHPDAHNSYKSVARGRFLGECQHIRS